MKLLLKNLLFTLLIPGTVAGWIPWLIVRDAGLPSWRHLLIAAPFFAIGVGIYTGTTFNFAVVGRGTPAPIDAPCRLVVQGPHRYVRNPMYLGVLAVVLGWAIAFRSLSLAVYLGFIALVFHTVVLIVEEPALRSQFGSEYAAYRTSVRRWVPGCPYTASARPDSARRVGRNGTLD